MTRRERVLAAFRFEEVRPTPYTVWYDHETMENLDRHYGGPDWRSRIHDHILRLSVDWQPRRRIDDQRFADIHGTIWQEGDPVHVVEPALKEPGLRSLAVPSYVPYLHESRSPEPGSRHSILPLLSLEDTRQRLEVEGDSVFTVVGYGYGFFESAWMIRGYENFFADLLWEPEFVNDLLDLLLDRHLELLDVLLALPCDGVIFSDDYGDQRGVIIGPKLWRTFVKPRLAKLYEKVHAAGKMTFQHTCGSVFDIIPDLIEAGLDVLQSLQPEAMPVYEIKERYGDRLRLWGGLGTPDEIRAEVRRLKQEMGRDGGYVLTSSKPVMKEVPIENAVAYLEEVLTEDV